MTDRRKKCMPQWSDLPLDLLSSIAESLELIDLLGFRGVCKSWKSASSTASAQFSANPWFILHGENNSECQLVSESDNKYTISLPELDGATCLASYQGWLLVYQETSGSMFFFCPFSRARIDIPNPFANSQKLSYHIAAFSSPPTCQDCIVCVFSRTNNNEWQLNLLRRGAGEWTRHIYSGETKIKKIDCAVYLKEYGVFYFVDPGLNCITFSTENLTWQYYYYHPKHSSTSGHKAQKFRYRMYYFHEFKRKLDLAKNVSVSTCGIQMQNSDRYKYICGESITAYAAEVRQLKGVWIDPRFNQVSSDDQSW